MRLVDQEGNEVTSKKNEEANNLEQELSKQVEKLLEPTLNRIKLSGSQIPQEQLMQLFSMAHSMLFNRMVYNLAIKMGYKNIDDLISENDVEEMQTNLQNQIQMASQDEEQQGGNEQQGSGPEGFDPKGQS